MIEMTVNDFLLTMAALMMLMGVITFGIGVYIIVAKVVAGDVRSLATQTAKLAQKGITDDVSGLVGNASILDRQSQRPYENLRRIGNVFDFCWSGSFWCSICIDYQNQLALRIIIRPFSGAKMLAADLITTLRGALPTEESSNLIAALRQDPLVWQSLHDDAFLAKVLKKAKTDPTVWCPANLAILGLGVEVSLTIFRHGLESAF